MIICAKTLEIEKNINYSDDNLYHGDNIIVDSEEWKDMKRCRIYKSFSLKKENKLFVEFGHWTEYATYVLVFDIEKQIFYFEEKNNRHKIIHSEIKCKFDRNFQIVPRGEEYFGLVLTSWIEHDSDEDSDDFDLKYRYFPVYNELRSYNIENDVLVEKEVIWKGEASYVTWKKFRNWVKVFSTVVVQNIYLD